MNKSAYLILVVSCWWVVACIESNPQPMPHGKNDISTARDTVSVGDASAEDGSVYEEVAVEDMSMPDDLVSPDVPLTDVLTDVGDVGSEVEDGGGEVTDALEDLTDGTSEVTDGLGEVADSLDDMTDAIHEVEEGDVEVLDVPGELDGVLLESIEDPGTDS